MLQLQTLPFARCSSCLVSLRKKTHLRNYTSQFVLRMTSNNMKKIILETGAEDTMVLMEHQVTLAKRRRLSVSCCRSVTDVTESGSSTKKCNKRKRIMDAVEDQTLGLQVVPNATQMKRHRLNASMYHRLDVKKGNILDAEILGQQCQLVIDSGTCCTSMFFSQANKLGLLTGNEKKMRVMTLLWDAFKEVDIIYLKDVAITMQGDVQMRTPMTVFPKEMEQGYACSEEIIIGLSLLHRGSMFQTFNDCGSSSLYVRKFELLKQRPNTHSIHKQLEFYVRREGRNNIIPVLLDTGAPDFYTTAHLMWETGCSVMPRRTSLHLGDGSFLETGLEVRPTSDMEYTLGCKLFYKYNAVLDYGRALVTFIVGGKYLRIYFGKVPTH